MRRTATVTGLILVAGMLASCAQLGPSLPTAQQGPSAAASAPVAASASASAAPTADVPKVSAAAQVATAQLGVQVFWHEVNDANAVKANADRLFDYVVGLGANSVGISFPIYTDGVRPTRVYTKDGVTPTPASLQTVVGEARARGLRVLLRPLIDEANIRDAAGAWRGSIKPPSMTGWFDSYQSTLMPFLAAAQAAQVDTFVLGAEMDSLVGQVGEWRALAAAAARVFKGHLAYAHNWGEWAAGRPSVTDVDQGLDAYPQLRLSDSSSVSQITVAWKAWLQRRSSVLTTTVVQEIGISATPGAYKAPAAWAMQGQTVTPQIQANWFAGACAAVRSLHMPGLYFWNLDAWADPANAASYTAGSFIGRGDSAIKACFAADWTAQ